MATNIRKCLPLFATISISGILLGTTIKLYDLTKARRNSYNAGIINYRQGKCEKANQYFYKLETELVFLDHIENLTDGLEKYKTECNAWIATNNKIDQAFEAKNLPEVPLLHLSFIKNNPESEINKVARKNNLELLDRVNPQKFASVNSCSEINSLESYGLFSYNHLPYLNLGCIEVHRQEFDLEQELDFQVKFLSEYPNHNEVLTVKQGLILNPLICSNTEQLRKNKAASQWGNLMPVVHLACGKAHQEVLNYEEAIYHYQSLEYYSSEDELVSQSEYYLASVENEIDEIAKEMLEAADVIEGRIAACTTGIVIAGPVINFFETFSGTDCMTGNSLNWFQRIINVVPTVSKIKALNDFEQIMEIIDVVHNIVKIQSVNNSLQDRQAFLDYLYKEDEMKILKINNPKLTPLIENINKEFDMSVHYPEIVEFL